MTTDELQRRVEAELTGAQIEVTTDGYYFNIVAVSDLFDGKRPVQRQQLVYAGINDLIADGSLHAVNIQTYTPEEFSGKNAESQSG